MNRTISAYKLEKTFDEVTSYNLLGLMEQEERVKKYTHPYLFESGVDNICKELSGDEEPYLDIKDMNDYLEEDLIGWESTTLIKTKTQKYDVTFCCLDITHFAIIICSYKGDHQTKKLEVPNTLARIQDVNITDIEQSYNAVKKYLNGVDSPDQTQFVNYINDYLARDEG